MSYVLGAQDSVDDDDITELQRVYSSEVEAQSTEANADVNRMGSTLIIGQIIEEVDEDDDDA